MRGLIIKDFLCVKKALRSYIIMILFYYVLAVIGFFPFGTALSMGQAIVTMLPLSTFSYDDFSKWNEFAVSLPLSRKTIVLSRYFFSLILACAIAALNFLVAAILSVVGNENFSDLAIPVCVVFFYVLFIYSVLFPLIYKVGIERARPALFIFTLLPIAIAFLFAKAFPSLASSIVSLPLMPIACIGLLFVCTACVFSFFQSLRIFSKKDF